VPSITSPSECHPQREQENKNLLVNMKKDLGAFLNNSIETLLKNPISSIKSRKRKISEELDLK